MIESADPRDDFTVFDGNTHMFFGLRDPFGLIRASAEDALRGQVADTELDAIETFDEPQFLTLGRKVSDEGRHVVVTHYGFAVRARLSVTYDGGSQRAILASTLTFLFANIDQGSDSREQRMYLDFHEDPQQDFTGEIFKERFFAFRRDNPPPDA